MNQNLLWKGIAIVAIVASAAYVAYPPGETIHQGLDLQGGIHLVLEVQTGDAVKAETDKDMERLVQEARDEGLDGLEVQRTADAEFQVLEVASEQEATIASIVDKHLLAWDWRRVNEVLAFEMRPEIVAEIRELAVLQALQTIRNRVDAFGVAEPVIQRQGLGGSRLVVQLPGVDDPERVKRLIKSTAFLEFRLVEFPLGGGGVSDRQTILANYGGEPPDNLEILSGDERDQAGRIIGKRYYAVQKRRVITGRDLKTARPGLGEFNQPVVNFSLTHDGGVQFGEATAANVDKGLAIVLDGKVVSAPRIKTRITDSGIIEGSFTQQEVQDLSTTLRSGALPAGIKYLEERTVGPSLGRDSIRKGVRAGLVGGVLVILAMLVVYLRTGVNAVVALSLNVVLVFGALAYLGATLTLPGIAGIILTIGMAVDANVLVFERIREELRGGRTVKSAVSSGFSKALSSILDANITTLIAAVFLFQFGTGPIRGFAVTLSIGILASLFTAVFVSRWLFDLFLSRRTRVEKLSI